jgi:hypothetical protein
MRVPFVGKRNVACSSCGYFCVTYDKRLFLGQRGGTLTSPGWDEYDEVTVLDEVTPQARGPNATIQHWPYARKLQCVRHAFALEDELKAIRPKYPKLGDDVEENKRLQQQYERDVDEAYRRVINGPRKCPFQFRYRQGFGPELHRELEVEERRARQARIWGAAVGLLGAMIGAGATIAGVILARGG